ELRLERRIDDSKERVHFAAPCHERTALPQQCLRLVLEPRRRALGQPIDAGLGLDARDAGRRFVQLAAWHARQLVEQCAVVALLRREQQGPLLELDEDEGVHRRRQTREQLAVLLLQRRGLARQSRVELHRERSFSAFCLLALAFYFGLLALTFSFVLKPARLA